MLLLLLVFMNNRIKPKIIRKNLFWFEAELEMIALR